MPGRPPSSRRSLELAFSRLSRDRRHGSGWIAEQALSALRQFLEPGGDPEPKMLEAIPALRALARSQRPMALLEGLAGAFEQDPNPEHLLYRLRCTREAIADQALPLWIRTSRALTLSSSMDVYAVLARAWRAGKLERVYIARSWPGGEGADQARRLATLGIPTVLFPDRYLRVALEASTMAWVGADSVWEDGTVLGKVGVQTLGRLCVALRRPLYVTASTWKIRQGKFPPGGADRRALRLAHVPYGQRSPSARNLFETLPAEWIHGILTESGPWGGPARLGSQGRINHK